MTQPAHDVRVSPVEELKLKADVEDDFGLTRHGLSFSMAGGEAREIVLKAPAAGNRQVHAQHLTRLRSRSRPFPISSSPISSGPRISGRTGRRGAHPATCSLPRSGTSRRSSARASSHRVDRPRTRSRKAARITPGRSDQLAELQKEIINGTWKLIRRETRHEAVPTSSPKTARCSQESQHSAIEKAGQLAERLQDAASKASLDQATKLMKDAEKHLTEVAEKSSIPALNPALAAEQAAYQALLKLRAREFQVIRNNSRRQQQSGRSAAGRSATAAASAARARRR